jgi:hypothetical protein
MHSSENRNFHLVAQAKLSTHTPNGPTMIYFRDVWRVIPNNSSHCCITRVLRVFLGLTDSLGVTNTIIIRKHRSKDLAYGTKIGRFLWKWSEVHPLSPHIWKLEIMCVLLRHKNQNSMTIRLFIQALSCSGLITPESSPTTFASRTKRVRRCKIQHTA